MPVAPAWLETVLRLLAAILGMYLSTHGSPEGGVTALGVAAVGDLPFRLTSTGASSGREQVAKEVVVEKVEPSARK